MMVELIQGPCDGLLWEVPDGEKIVIVNQPGMSAAEFIAASDRPDLFAFAQAVPIEHAYRWDPSHRNPEGLLRFVYAGVRS
jgi:hypothetical protein